MRRGGPRCTPRAASIVRVSAARGPAKLRESDAPAGNPTIVHDGSDDGCELPRGSQSTLAGFVAAT